MNTKPLDPPLTDVLLQFRKKLLREINCVKIGTIDSFDPSAKTAVVKLLFSQVYADGSVHDYPLLVDCPVFTLQGGGCFVQMPIAPGDQCLVLFCDRNLDTWFSTGAKAAPNNGRVHDLADGIALVGLNATTSGMPDYLPTVVTLGNAVTTLNALIQNLLTVLAALQVTGPLPLTAASIAAIEALSVQFAGLLG